MAPDPSHTYPIGRYLQPVSYSVLELQQWTNTIAALPRWLDGLVENMDEALLHTGYRPGGWTVHQVIHHLADSHVNAYVRTRLALTEHSPTVKPYDENAWALLPDVAAEPVNVSITLLHALHRRWVTLLRALTPDQWLRTIYHPEQQRTIPLWELTAHYAWHSRHHMEQIRGVKERGWIG